MKVHFERSGGFAGIRKAISIDSEQLPAEDKTRLQALVEAADFNHLPREIHAPSGADRFQYRISIETDVGSHDLTVDESAAPPTLRPLIQWLSGRAK